MGAPPPNRGAVGKAPEFELFLFLYTVAACRCIPALYSSPPKSSGSQQGPQACWVVGKVYLTYLMIATEAKLMFFSAF